MWVNVDGKDPAEKTEKKVIIRSTRSLTNWDGGGDRALGPSQRD